jgi:pimeloyl-ACP methyl ester carboxylesterase
MAMEVITSTDGAMIAYTKRGWGQPLLLVHGTTVDHTVWSALSPHLEPYFTVYAMDRRGRGASGDAPHYDFVREVEDIRAVIEAIGEPVVLFGHSFGALCSLEAALLSDKVSRLILYEPPVPTGIPAIPKGVPDRIQALCNQGKLEAALELFLREGAKMAEQELASYRQSPMWHATLPVTPTIPREIALDRTYRFQAERFARLQVPVLLLTGSESPPFYREGTALVASALPGSRIVVLPGHQHIAHLSEPELVAREVLHFLLRQEAIPSRQVAAVD